MRPIGRLWEAWTQLGRSAQRLLATNAEQREPTRGGQVSHIHPVTHPSLSQESSPSTHPPPLTSQCSSTGECGLPLPMDQFP